MPLIPLKIQPGLYQNGTDFEQSNRWRDGSLIRWSEGSLRPVGGWNDFSTSSISGAPRGMHIWRDYSQLANIVVGTFSNLYHVSSAGAVSDITPSGYTSGRESAEQETGFGNGLYNVGTYNTPRPSSGDFLPATTWSIDNFGENLVACADSDGLLYEWTLNTGTPAAQIANSPTGCTALVVTEERFIFALGADGNPRKIQWCDRENNTLWTPAATNEAGDIELQTNGTVRTACRVRGRTLIITDQDAHVATYQGPPYVYGFERIGSACGTESPKSLVPVDQFAFWMGPKGFFMYDGSLAKEMPCDVSDKVFRDINEEQLAKVYGLHNSQFSEVWWFYPSASSNDNDRYVSYDYKDNIWSFGVLDRTAGVDAGILKFPIWADANGDLYSHEFGFNHQGSTPFVESGPISLGNGDTIMKVNELIPDEQTQGQVSATFKTRFYPNDTERSYGPYTMSSPTSVRFSGRQVRMRVETETNTDWRVGTMRINGIAGGNR
jgi:hypothetical protein